MAEHKHKSQAVINHARHTNHNEPEYKYVGTRPVRHDGLDKVTGRARFAADLNLPGQLFGVVVRSPYTHARILSIDTSKALIADGVQSVITGKDFPAVQSGDPHHDMCVNLMARDKVFYEGHAVAAVAAGTREQAYRAAKAVIVEYDPLPEVLTIDEALKADGTVLHSHMFTTGVKPRTSTSSRSTSSSSTPSSHLTLSLSKPSPPSTQPPAPSPSIKELLTSYEPSAVKASNVNAVYMFSDGDVDMGFRSSDVVVEREFTTKPVHQGYIEPHAVVADTGQDGRSTVWCSSQGHFNVRSQTAAMLGWETARIKVIPAEIGGGFGGKTTIYLEPLAVLLSLQSGRPVKMVMTRDEVFRATGPAPGAKIHIKLGADRQGHLVAGEAHMAYSTGAFGTYAGDFGARAIFESYRIPNFLSRALGVVLNTPRSAAYRAPSAPAAAFAMETVLDELAEMLEIDPIELRLRNAVVEGDKSTTGVPFARVGLVECLEAMRDHPHYNAPLEENCGRGVASGYWFNIGEASSVVINLNEEGTATVVTGSPDIGGSRVSMALMAAEELGIHPYRIKPVVGDTESVGFTEVTDGSRVTFATGMAVVKACQAIILQLRERAAIMLGVDVSDINWVDGHAVYTNPATPVADTVSLSLKEITQAARATGGPITTTGSLEAKGAGPGFAVHMCDVKVDKETGVVRVIRYTASQDAGKAIHPSYVEGQIQGGVAQGIGWALSEEYVYNSEGVMENPSFLDYRIPVASDLPMIDTVIVECPNPHHPYGVRGVGETNIVPPIAAVANAIYSAIGCRLRHLPMSPMRVLEAVNTSS